MKKVLFDYFDSFTTVEIPEVNVTWIIIGILFAPVYFPFWFISYWLNGKLSQRNTKKYKCICNEVAGDNPDCRIHN